MPTPIRPLDRDALRSSFRAARPFPFVSVDDFLEEGFAREVAECYPSQTDARRQGRTFYGVNEMKKVQVSDAAAFPGPVARLADALVAPEFLATLSHVSGIENLSGDPAWRGGGMHLMPRDSYLDVHVDFNVTGEDEATRYRRLNVLVFLNEDWQDDWCGGLELWDADVAERQHLFLPVFNRCVLFETSEVSFHGVQRVTCPPDRRRKSFAGYYYTADAPRHFEGIVHGTTFRARPDEKLKGRVLMPLQSIAHKAFTKLRKKG